MESELRTMSIPEPPFEGACLCGAVRVRVTASPLLTVACHCRDCQKFSASAFSLTTMFPSDSFSYDGELVLGGLGSVERAHYFCKSCLNFIYSQLKGAPERVNLRTSILDQAASFEPFLEVMTEAKMPWVDVPAVHSYSRFPETPEELQSLMRDYSKR
ncbi:GFA family protein [Ruegeria conchae]|uniref:GFA family protein n=1 Tax=Ruegeria conchae TaxID=981384 RepID=UPI0029C6727E|nr:GFA family protein [Ruegeria conchae]